MRPSELLDLQRSSPDPFVDPAYVSYCLDEAAFLWGTFVESEIQQAEDRGDTKSAQKPENRAKRRHGRLLELLNQPTDPVAPGDDKPVAPPAKRFADPADRFR